MFTPYKITQNSASSAWAGHFTFTNIFILLKLNNIIIIFSNRIAHNVSAVCDVLPARTRALRSKDQGWQNVGGVSRGSGA
jgi:hypothetical protein